MPFQSLAPKCGKVVEDLESANSSRDTGSKSKQKPRDPETRKPQQQAPRRQKFTGPAPRAVASPEAASKNGENRNNAPRRTPILRISKVKEVNLSFNTPDTTDIPRKGYRGSTQRVKETSKSKLSRQNHSRPGVDLDKLARQQVEQREKHSKKIKAGLERRKREGPRPLPAGDSLEQDLEQDAGLPNASFTPGPKQLARMVEILSCQPRDPDRRRMVRRLGEEFRRIYTKYRRRFQPNYSCFPSQYKFAERAATLCVMHEVRPAKLIGYWAEHVGDFTEMKYPSLAFLSSPGNVDQVACMRAPADGGGPVTARAGKASEVDAAHDFADTDKLDPRLRPGLVEAGFDLSGIDDRYLLTVQGAAQAIAGGFPLFVAGNMRPWADWAAEHLYAGIEPLV
ncbi:hypothetical protein LCGC14_1233700 [marine sediment metagenome]|uniref:Uncharacterized protein n=1 Tax=marine sediment metagenome TaxID=412755 RepID=A0A0F9PC20_9ZZZZ